MNRFLKKLLAALGAFLFALVLICAAALPAHASESQEISDAAGVAAKIDEARETAAAGEASAEDEAGVVVAQLDTPSDADAYLDGLSDEERLYVGVRVEMSATGASQYSIVVYAEPVWLSEDEAASDYSAPSEVTNASFKATLKSAWDDLSKVIYVKNFGLQYNEEDTADITKFDVVYYQAVWDTPEQFNTVSSFDCSYDPKTKVVSQVKPFYLTTDAATYATQRQSYEAKINEALATIPCGASDVQKLYLLHNWICEHSAYNYSALDANQSAYDSDGNFLGWDKYKYPEIYTSYGMVVNGAPVCQGYALALSDMLNRVGIENQELHVYGHNHDWNLVKVDGSWYHVDVTWDNESYYYDGAHYTDYYFDYFLKSDTAINQGYFDNPDDGTHKDWTDTNNAFGWKPYMAATNTMYDGYSYSDWDSFDATAGTTANHSWNAGKITTEPTCSSKGVKTYTCTKCSVTKTETVAAKGGSHTFGPWQTVNAATCTEEGFKRHTCTRCGFEETEVLAPTGKHTWDAGKITKAPTPSADGVKTYTCTVCGTTKTEALPKYAEVIMHRLYNPYSGEHLYTADAKERNTLTALGWKYEGVAWTAPSTSKTPVYRLYNKYSGDHHYTTNKSEYDACIKQGWNGEGVGFYSDDAKRVTVYRLYNKYLTAGTHHYTTSKKEYDDLGKIGWSQENIGWYGVK